MQITYTFRQKLLL